MRITCYFRQQLAKLIAQYRDKHWIGCKNQQNNGFSQKYTREDVLLLALTDEYHLTLSGGATKKLFERAFLVHKDSNYQRLSNISISHIYNLRKSQTYKTKRLVLTKTNSKPSLLGERKKPYPDNKPGYIRVDTVHQGDFDGCKGVYHINAVDEVTQFEVVCSVEKISEMFLIPILEMMLNFFPFKIINFHSDNGSEYINQIVVKLLNSLHISLTKSRARHSNDNALAESKNGSIIRKQLGYMHIPQKWAPLINEFNCKYLVPYINFHRPCYFVKIKINEKNGKQTKTYPYELMMTPYDKFKSLENASSYLKEGITFEELDRQALAISDLEAAKQLCKAKSKLFANIFAKEKDF
jgi:transposase InsO family protein